MLHKIKALLLLGVFLPIGVFAQFTVSGLVQDMTTSEFLPGAHIIISNQLIVSDNKGNFKAKNLLKGVYQIKVTYIGYADFTEIVEITSNKNLVINMQASEIMEDEVVIVGSRASDYTGTSFTTLTKADIKKADSGLDIPYILDMTPGLITTSDGGTGIGYTAMRIRGSDISRINMTINGIPLNDPESQGAWFVDLPDLAASLNSIQVQRGVGTSVNGPAAFGATIDLQTQGLESLPFGEVSIGYGSFNTQKYRLSGSTGLINNKYTFDFRISKISSDGYIDRATSNLKSFYFSTARYSKNSILRFNIFSGKERTYQAWYGVPKDSLNTNRTYNPYSYKDEVDDYTQTHFQLLYTQKVNKYWLINSALHYTKGAGYYENFKENKSLSGYGLNDYIIGNDTISSTDLVQQKWLVNDFYGFTFNANYTIDRLKLVVGGAANQFIGNHFGKIIWSEYALMGKDYEWYRNKGTKTDINIFAKAIYFINSKLNVYGDLQNRIVNYAIDGIHDDLHSLTNKYDFNFFNPKVGMVYKMDHHEVYGSLAVANREPSRNNYRDADINYSPKPEYMEDFELGYAYSQNSRLARINFYYMNYKDQLVETGKVNNVGAPIMTNVDKSYRAGVEFIAGIKPNNYFEWNFNASLSQNKIMDFTEYVDNWDTWGQESKYLGKTDISFSPNIILKNNLNLQLNKNFEIALQSQYIGRQFIDNTSNLNRSLDPYFISNLIVLYNPEIKGLKELTISFRINNLFDEPYESSAWVYRYITGGKEYSMDGYFPQAGINFSTGISLKF